MSREGVLIFPVKSIHALQRNNCSPQGLASVKSRHTQVRDGDSIRYTGGGTSTSFFQRKGGISPILFRLCAVLLLTAASAAALAQSLTIDQIRVIGNRRIPKETILARLFTHVGDTYDPSSVERDFNSLWNTGYFEDLRIEREDTEKGVVLVIYLKEKPNIREIKYNGLNSVTESDVLDRYKKEKVSLSQESQYDATKVKQAETVIKELLAEHGHQFATIKTEVKNIPPASVQIIFNIKEGPTVKVGNIRFVGNQHISSLVLRRSMKNLKPIGIPYSIVFENLFAKTFDSSRLEEDAERVRQAYRDKGYYNAAVESPRTQIRDQGGLNFFTFRPNKGKRIDILMPVEEGERYRLAGIHFTGNKAVTNVRALRASFPLKDGDWFSATLTQKGMDNLKKAYGQLGYINFGLIPKADIDEAKKTVTMTMDIDEGKPFYVGRIEIQGNTLTRDRVIRRELLLQEGQVYNSNLWEMSLLRLNQLDYFDPLKVDQDSEAHQDTENGTVDLLLKVKEKGKNSIGLNGGVSGLSGAFLGLNYQTNNFLGLGETLSLQANIGNINRQFLFGFTQPYFKNKPINLGIQLFNTKSDYNSAKALQATSGQSANLTTQQQSLLQNYNNSTVGMNFSLSYPLPRHNFQRVGFTYSLTDSDITAFSTASQNLFQNIAFRSGIQGQNALNGIVNSNASFSYTFNTVSNPIRPRNGKEISAVFQIAGIGGNVRYIFPAIAYKQFFPMHNLKFDPEGRNILGWRLEAKYIQGWGGDVAPPNNRFYAGGEADIRGFDIRTATPYAYIPNKINFNLTNPDGTCVPRDPNNPQLNQCIQVLLPVYSVVSVGGDFNLTNNLEYRIPIAGPVTFAFFDDFSVDTSLNGGQLRESPEGAAALNAPLYGCPVYNNGACEGGTHVTFDPRIRPLPGTNLQPRMSLGAEIVSMMPIINAPVRLYYAINPLKLNEQVDGENLITRDMFPPGGAGDYSYAQAIQLYGSRYQLREPAKTFRLTVSTTF
ncbi:outer membrane protein assembly factor BamA [Acidicapsa dinghuensis]|uniref:Outer membrane protein assembly factor BamA n=1 Tax=Acidicapsa dinghuensis TaxID=2218256 RepID=A0ABW1EBA1_9BACT|nr:outer membrane protein assembly factor BamA [Acidicapsa dinghuensis]